MEMSYRSDSLGGKVLTKKFEKLINGCIIIRVGKYPYSEYCQFYDYKGPAVILSGLQFNGRKQVLHREFSDNLKITACAEFSKNSVSNT